MLQTWKLFVYFYQFLFLLTFIPSLCCREYGALCYTTEVLLIGQKLPIALKIFIKISSSFDLIDFAILVRTISWSLSLIMTDFTNLSFYYSEWFILKWDIIFK